MFRSLTDRMREGREEGFTLIELMVVVLIIAILIAIAIPTFLGARQRAQDKAAQSSIRNALTAAKTIYTDNSDYADVTTSSLLSVEPSLTYEASATASTGPKDVSVNVTPTTGTNAGQVIYMAALSKSGTCFYLADNVGAAGAGFPAQGTTFAKSSNACTGAQATSESFSASW